MTTLTITLDLADKSGIEQLIHNLSLLLGKTPPAPAPAGAAGKITAPAGAARSQTGGASAQQGSTAATGGEAGNAAQGAGQAAGATGASSSTPGESPSVTFDAVKSALLGLVAKKQRPAGEAVLKEFNLAKLSDAKPEQYAQLKAALDKAAA
jgi:hypothetical protein